MTFSSIFTTDSITIVQGLIVTGVALVLGLISSLVYRFKSYCSKSFAVTLTIIPAIVAMLIMMVNGLATGAGIAVLGVFSLVRFRSQPGSSREILAIMLSMAIGLACGGGYITFAVFAAAVVCIVWLILFTTMKVSSTTSSRNSPPRTRSSPSRPSRWAASTNCVITSPSSAIKARKPSSTLSAPATATYPYPAAESRTTPSCNSPSHQHQGV